MDVCTNFTAVFSCESIQTLIVLKNQRFAEFKALSLANRTALSDLDPAGHRRPAAAPLPRRCPGIRQASDGPRRAYGLKSASACRFGTGRPLTARSSSHALPVPWHPPSSDGSRSGPGGPQPARSTSAALTVHRGPGGPLTSCSTSAALSCPIRTPPPVKSARGCGFGPTWIQPPAFISSRVKFVYLHKHENP